MTEMALDFVKPPNMQLHDLHGQDLSSARHSVQIPNIYWLTVNLKHRLCSSIPSASAYKEGPAYLVVARRLQINWSQALRKYWLKNYHDWSSISP